MEYLIFTLNFEIFLEFLMDFLGKCGKFLGLISY